MKIRNLFLEKPNEKFRSMTRSRKQVTGLSVCLDMITHSVKDSLKLIVSDMRQIEHGVSRFAPKNLILGHNFLTTPQIRHIKKKYPHLKIFMIIHSPISFMSVDHYALKSIYDYTELGVSVIVNDPRLENAIKGTIHLENCYRSMEVKRERIQESGVYKVICAGSVRMLKNHLAQALAMIIYCDKKGKKLEFYCNLGRTELGGATITSLQSLFAKNSNHKLINLEWMEHKEFMNSLNNYDLGMQVSFTESYNIVAADYVTASLPVIGSHEIRFIHDDLKVFPNDINAMCEKADIAINYVEENKKILKELNEKAVSRWNEVLN